MKVCVFVWGQEERGAGKGGFCVWEAGWVRRGGGGKKGGEDKRRAGEVREGGNSSYLPILAGLIEGTTYTLGRHKQAHPEESLSTVVLANCTAK